MTSSAAAAPEELFDVLDESGAKTGVARPRSEVHALGLLHRAVHVWLLAPSRGELLLQLRARCKDSWPGRWDISCAGHLSAGDESAAAAERELGEELGFALEGARRPRLLFEHFERLDSLQNGRPFRNHEFNDVFLLELSEEERARPGLGDFVLPPAGAEEGQGPADAAAPVGANARWALQRSEVEAVRWVPFREVLAMYECDDEAIVPLGEDKLASYRRLFDECERVCAQWAGRAAGEAPR